MFKTTRFLAALLLITAVFSLLSIALAADISVSANANEVLVRAANNDGMAFDIKGYETKEQVYLFLPYDVDVKKMLVTFGSVTKQLDLSSPKTVDFKNGTYQLIAMKTNLPVLNMSIDESKGTIAAMNKDADHKTKCFGGFYLDVPKYLTEKYGWQDYYADANSEIKGRGNATWSLEKKAYQIKLDKKQSILEMGKDKTWIILANYGDRSLIRNKLAYDMAKDMGLEYSLDSEFVDVYFNGEYQGNYLLTEKVEVGKQRVDIYDLEEKDENPDADRVTGGYLIEYDRLAQSEATWTVGPHTGRFISIKSPEVADDAQKAYITTFINNMESAIYAEDGKSAEGKHYSEYMDVDSFIKLYWINEIFKNGDFFYGSTFMYKDVGADEKLYSGPAWDFDITLANACSNAGAETPARQANLATPVGWWARTVADGFTKYLFTHEDFRLRNKEIYDSVVAELLLNLPNRAQEYADYILPSANMNFVRWNVLKQDHQWQTPNKAVTYEGEIAFVKNYLTRRGEWIHDTMNSELATSNLGTEQNPIKIETAQDLIDLSENVNAGDSQMGYCFRQTADIDLSGVDFLPIGYTGDFMGEYDGGGFAIKNLTISTAKVNDSSKPAGLFGSISGGSVSNVNIESGNIAVVAREVGGVVGLMSGGKVYNCTNKATVTNLANGGLEMAGGVVGHMLSGTQNQVINCINYGAVSAPNAAYEVCRGVGGVIGHASSNATAVALVNLGTVTVPFASQGGPVGSVLGELSGRRARVSQAFWLTGEGMLENGEGETLSPDDKKNSTFSGGGYDAKDICSDAFVYEMNKNLFSAAQTGGVNYTMLRMWCIKDGTVAFTDNFAHIDLLPKIEPQWIMSNRSLLYKLSRGITGAKAEFEEDTVVIKPENRDPIISVSLALNEQFSADEYHYVAIKMKTISTVDYGGIFFGTDKFPGPVAECYSKFDVVNDGRWHDYIIDMSKYEHGRWHGMVNVFRLDPINAEDKSAVISIERVGVFKTHDEAQDFLSASPKMSTVLYDDIQTVYLSENTINAKGEKDKYMLKDNVLPAQKPHENAQVVVVYVDNGGNENVLPVCFTDSQLYSSYIANKPGKYKLAYGYKEYSDISSHWGREYIDFVSARGLFGGTSPTEFSPDEAMTRGMFITVLGRMHGVDNLSVSKAIFDDVAATEYYAPYVQWAAENGLIETLGERSFYPDSPISRSDMALIIYKYIIKFSYSVKPVSEPIYFTDLGGISDSAQLAVQTIQKTGILNGKGQNLFDPMGHSTRAEVATVMTRLIKSILEVL